MNKSTLFIILGVIAAIALVYYFSQSSGNPPSLAPKCCVKFDALGNCTGYVWCSSGTNSVVSDPTRVFVREFKLIPSSGDNTPAGAK